MENVNITQLVKKQLISDENAKEMLGRVCVGYKLNGKRFVSKLIAIEQEFFVFETKTRLVMRDRKEELAELQVVA